MFSWQRILLGVNVKGSYVLNQRKHNFRINLKWLQYKHLAPLIPGSVYENVILPAWGWEVEARIDLGFSGHRKGREMAELPTEQGKNGRTLALLLLLPWESYKGVRVLAQQLGVLTWRQLGVVAVGHRLTLTSASAGTASAADLLFPMFAANTDDICIMAIAVFSSVVWSRHPLCA